MTTAVPSSTPPSKMDTVLLGSAEPVRVGVVTFVSLSVDEEPESEPTASDGVVGNVGAMTSMVMTRADDAADRLPAASVAVAVSV